MNDKNETKLTDTELTEYTVAENTIPVNTLAENTTTDDTITGNTITENPVAENTVTENTTSDNTAQVPRHDEKAAVLTSDEEDKTADERLPGKGNSNFSSDSSRKLSEPMDRQIPSAPARRVSIIKNAYQEGQAAPAGRKLSEGYIQAPGHRVRKISFLTSVGRERCGGGK